MKTDKIYVRNCPNCNKELITKNKYWHLKCQKNNSVCGSCSLKGRIFTEDWKNKLKVNHANISGELNPFKGKSHSKESIDKMLLTRSKHPTWKQNASNTMKKIRNEYWYSKNPMDNPDSVNKIRLARINEIRDKNNGQISPNYNKNSISILEEKAKELGITDLQHAENGGEFYIKEFGYWVDGYSKEKNIVIEYYEKYHKTQIKKDKLREEQIKNLLGCQFIIINESNEN
jgi:hypothetical protein